MTSQSDGRNISFDWTTDFSVTSSGFYCSVHSGMATLDTGICYDNDCHVFMTY